nr:trigger factor [Pelagibius sp. Alg239-R121]
MQVTETQAEELKREYTIVIPATEIDEKIDGRLKELSGQVNLPGFRPGKVPMSLLKQRFGKSVLGEVLEKAVTDSSSQALSERSLRPAMQPKIEVTSFDEGKDLEYTMSVELLPDVTPMDFGSLELERIKVAVPDPEVDEALERIAESHKTSKPLDKPRKAKLGDVVIIDFKGTVDGEALPGMAAEDHHLELGSNQFIPGFEDQLVGVNVDDDCEVKVTFPDTYGNDKLAGREAIFEVKVKGIEESVPAEIDDKLAEALGAENLDAMKLRVREQIEGEYAKVARSRLKRELLDKLADGHDFAVPAGMVDVEFEGIWKQVEEERKQGDVDDEDAGKDDEELKTEYRAIAERRVRLGLLLSEVGSGNNIDVSQDEVNRALFAEAQNYPGQEQQVFEYYKNTPEALANLRAPIFEDKVIDFITDLSKVTERELTPDELRKEFESESAEAEAAESKPAEKKKPAKKKPAKKAAAKSDDKAASKSPAKKAAKSTKSKKSAEE